MLGDDSDDGEEEILDEGGSLASASLGPVDPALSIPSSTYAAEAPPPPPPLQGPPAGWSRHRSSRYRDARHPIGYEYFFNPGTGETRWAEASDVGVGDERGDAKRARAAAAASAAAAAPSLWYASAPLDPLPVAELERLVALSDGHVKVVGPNHAQYFCDQQKREKWAFNTDRLGLELLCHLVAANQPALAACKDFIEREAAGAAVVLSEGRSIYTEKKHLIQGVEGHKKVTWSQDEYAHPGMQLMYLTLKSWQRFTETWALLERASRLGLFAPHRPPPSGSGSLRGRPVRVLSIGGGPGFELIAFERFFRRHGCDSSPVQLVSLDLMPGWRPFVEAMGMQFGEYDIEGPQGLLEVANALNAAEGKPPFPAHGVTYVVISYVMIYVSTDAVCDMLAGLLASKAAYCILVSERGEETKCLRMMEARGVAVHRLIDQANGLDERQSLWVDGATPLQPSPGCAVPTTFPNVPFEEGKTRKNRRA